MQRNTPWRVGSVASASTDSSPYIDLENSDSERALAVTTDPDLAQDRGDDAVATREVKLVQGGHGGLDALDHHFAEPTARAMKPGFHCLLGDTEALRRFGAAHALDGAEYEDGAKLVRQFSDR